MSIVERERTEVPVEVTRRDVLHRAADLIEEHGWIQSSYGALGQGFCLIGSVKQAHRDLGLKSISHADVSTTYPPDGGLWLAGWNDEPGRTKAEVVVRLREAAES